jgi:hypothetical protein
MSNSDVTKRRGRPATGKGTPITVRLGRDELELLDGWIEGNGAALSRPEAIRRLMEKGLAAG